MPLNPAGVPSMEAIQAAIDEAKPRSGVVTGSPTAGNAVNIAVTFSPPFATGVTPRIAFGLGHEYVDQLSVTFISLSSTGMTVRLYARSVDVPGVPVNYIAVAP